MKKVGESWKDVKINDISIQHTNDWKAREAIGIFVNGTSLIGKLFYDITDDSFYFGGNEIVQRINGEIVKELREKIKHISIRKQGFAVNL